MDTAIRIDILPCRGAPTYPTRSINSGRTHFYRVMPGLGRSTQCSPTWAQQRGRHAGLHPKRSGVRAHCPLHSCALRDWPVSRPSPLNTSASVPSPTRQSARISEQRHLRSFRKKHTTQSAHTYSRVVVSAKKARGLLRSHIQIH